ncbi:MAG: nitroreductase [Alphaproteobacteria bacterium]|nr:nitroreductase [Alphaproteobacteria bacterium]MBU0824464.1 nitroreductase [Alphaproteobacteria bacterium]MBU0864567.1 nitroreductase [Alphaproteobacteria bacterium]MBU1823453.1 nitroreductase [Alphaproteobacteria bacterium]
MPVTDKPTTDMGVAKALHQRRSIRKFTDQPVDPALLRDIFTAAQRAPSGGNLQPWQATVLTGKPWQTVKDAVAARLAMGREGYQPEYDIYPKGLTDPWETRRFGVGEGLYAALGIPREDKAGRLAQFVENYRGFGAPVMLFLHCSRIMGPPQWSDMGMWLQSVMLLLVEAGLASCPQECWAMYGKTVRETLALGDDQILFTGLAIGYADEGAAVNQWPVPRVGLDEVIDWQGF